MIYTVLTVETGVDDLSPPQRRSLQKHRSRLRREIEHSRNHIRALRQAGVRNEPLGWLSLAIEYAELIVLIMGDLADTLAITLGIYLVLLVPIVLAITRSRLAAGLATIVEIPVLIFKSKNRR